MLESFVSSRIRRTLLEYLLSHPNDRFYLRGLSKELGLSVSPLRRELKRLEHSGMLKAVPEGNMLFYAVDANSPAFLQLQALGTQDTRPKTQDIRLKTQEKDTKPLLPNLESPKHDLRVPLLAGTFAGAALLLLVGLAYVGVTRQHKTQITVVIPRASASGVMQGARWRVVPGGFGGGFSNGASDESY